MDYVLAVLSGIHVCPRLSQGDLQITSTDDLQMAESESHRRLRLGGICRHHPVHPLQGQLEQAAQVGSEYLQEWRLHNLSGQPMPVPGHPYGEKVFSCVQNELRGFSLYPLPLVLSLDTTEKSLSLQVLTHIAKILLSLLFFTLCTPIPPSFSS